MINFSYKSKNDFSIRTLKGNIFFFLFLLQNLQIIKGNYLLFV